MGKSFLTKSAKETRKFGEQLAKKLRGGSAGWRIIALQGELGSGKTTFTQGLLKGLGIKGPYTSPTFVIVKQYKLTTRKERGLSVVSRKFLVYHIDAYRIKAKDILALGWREIIRGKNNIIIIEWADRVKKIIPPKSAWVKFEWVAKNKRKIVFT